MNKNRFIAAASILLLLVLAAVVVGQRGRRNRYFDPDRPVDRGGVPNWENDPQFKSDIFTFVRIRYNSYAGWKWATDYPDSELNFSYRLQQLTSMKVHPEGLILELTDPRLFDYPFIYIIEPGDIYFLPEEVKALRRYLENGGFLMVDDFWGEQEWDTFYHAIKEVFPDREPEDVPLEHEIFHCVYKLTEKPQVPSINAALGVSHRSRQRSTYCSARDSARHFAALNVSWRTSRC